MERATLLGRREPVCTPTYLDDEDRMNRTREAERASVRHLVDSQGRAWHVREQRLLEGNLHRQQIAESVVLVYRCEKPGVLPELRRVCRALRDLDEMELLHVLQDGW